jgi:PAS domain S-box-containing protein
VALAADAVADSRLPRELALLAAVTGLYVAAAKGGLGLDVAQGVITPVWAPSGIAIAAVLVFGLRVWPAVALGAFIANATSGAGAAIALGLAVGNTLEAVSAGYVLRRIGFRVSLSRVRDVIAYLAVVLVVATPLAATNGVTILWASGRLHASYGSSWVLWWFGDTAGAVLVGTLLLVWFVQRFRRWATLQALEFATGIGVLAAVSVVVFLLGGWRYPYVLFPLLVGGALRFAELGAASCSFVAGALATAGVVTGNVPIGTTPTQGVQIVQALIVGMAITLLVVGATLSEREAVAGALQQAQELTHIGSWEWDIAADSVAWSDELFRIYGLTPQSLRVNYQTILERVHPEDRARVEAAVRGAYADRQPFELEHRVVHDGGEERTVYARGRVVSDEHGRPVRMLGTGQDISDRRQLERVRETILATVSHELRTPLTAVLGFAVTLRERHSELDESASTMVGQIIEQAHRLEALLSDLLDLDRYRRGLTQPARQPVRIDELVEHIVELHAPRAIEVRSAPLTARVDRSMLERIVDNLIGNAIKHTPGDARIAVAVSRQSADVLLAVEDGGPGVPREHHDSIFDLFTRGPDAAVPGTGIGLAIVSQFAAAHGGRAWLDDTPGRGATFKVLLPDCAV